MRMLPLVALPALLALALPRGAAAGEDLREQAFPWPVATFDVPCREHASLAIALGPTGADRFVLVGPEPSLVLEWRGPASRPMPDAQATLKLLLRSTDGDVEGWRAARAGEALVVLSNREGLGDRAEHIPKPGPDQGTLEFRIVVRPDEDLPPTGEFVQRTRFRVWSGTREEYLAFRRAESARWRAARASGVAYAPSSKERYVAPKSKEDSTHDTAFEVLETPASPEEDFDGSTIESVGVGRGHGGEPVTNFTVARARQAAFEAWTSRNVGLPMAIVLDGRVVSSPSINSPLKDNVQVTLGRDSWSEARLQAEQLLTTLRRARGEDFRVVAVAGRWSAGRRLVRVPLAGAEPLDVRVRAEGDAHGLSVRARYVDGAPGHDDVSGGLQAALAVGALGSEWAQTLVATTERRALLAALRKDYAWTDRGPIQADLLDLLGRFGADDPESMRLVVEAALDAREPVVSAAQRVLGREASRTAPVFDALVREAAKSPAPDARTAQAAELLNPLVPSFVAETLALLDHPEASVRGLGLASLSGLKGLGGDVLEAHGVGTRLLGHMEARVRGVGVWARLVEAGESGLVSHEALHLAALLRDGRVRTAARLQAWGEISAGITSFVRTVRPRADDVVALLESQLEKERGRSLGGTPDVLRLGAPVLERCVWWLTLDRLTEPVPTPTEAWLSLLQDPDPAVRALTTGASAQLRHPPFPVRERWHGLREDPDVDVRVLSRAALVVHRAAEPGDRTDVKAFLTRHKTWRWAPMVRELLRQTPP